MNEDIMPCEKQRNKKLSARQEIEKATIDPLSMEKFILLQEVD